MEQNINNTNDINNKNKIDKDRFSSETLLKLFISDSLKRKNKEKDESLNK